MAGVNRVIILGNLGADPEMRYTGSGTAVANLRVATSRRYTTKDESAKEDTEWHRVVVWGKQAESCKKYLAKGRKVYVEGRLQTRQWEDRDGNERYTTEIVAEQVQFIGGGGQSKGSGGYDGGSQRPPQNDLDSPADFGDDDIPF